MKNKVSKFLYSVLGKGSAKAQGGSSSKSWIEFSLASFCKGKPNFKIFLCKNIKSKKSNFNSVNSKQTGPCFHCKKIGHESKNPHQIESSNVEVKLVNVSNFIGQI